MNVQNISSLPDFIDKFIKFNHDKLIEIYDEGIKVHTEGLLYFQCDQEKNNVDVLFDDTEEHLSAKFKKFDLIGIPYQIILGSKSTNDKFEFKEVNGKTEHLSTEEIKKKLINKINLN